MRSTTRFWAMLAFGAGVAVWLWRNAQTREAARQALSTARSTLSNNETLAPVRDAVSKAGDAVKPVTDQVKDAASKAGDALKPVADQVKDVASKASDAVQPAVDQAKDVVSKASETLKPVVDQAKGTVSKVGDAVQPAVDQAKTNVSQTSDGVKPAADQVKDAVKPAIDRAKDAVSQAGDVAKPAIDQVMDAASQTAEVVAPTVDQAMDAAHQYGDEVEPVVDQAKDAVSEAGAAVQQAAQTLAPQTTASATEAEDLEPHDEDVAGVLDLDGENLTITQRVLSNIGHEAILDGVPHINVNTEEGGVVFLRGIVFTQEQREYAELVAATTEGVQSVVNELNIEQGGSSAQSTSETTAPAQSSEATGSQETDDEDVAGVLDLDGENLTITQRVLSNFGHESVLDNTPHINVNTQEQGVVYLRGVVATQEQRRVAQEVAARTEGVQSVVNELNVG